MPEPPYKYAFLPLILVIWLLCLLPDTMHAQAGGQAAGDADIINLDLNELAFEDDRSQPAALYLRSGSTGRAIVRINGEEMEVRIDNGLGVVEMETSRRGELISIADVDQLKLYHLSETDDGYRARHIPLWLSILPPLIAIALALIFKEVYIALVMGIWSGAFVAGGLRLDAPVYFFLSLFDTVEKYVISALMDSGHLAVIVFSLLIGGMVAIISKNGGMAGVVEKLSSFANSARSSQFVTWVLGVAIFFDDYANTLIVGNTMRGITDTYRISREKLAYIVDSTAAPVAAIALITTWIGAEIGYIDGGLRDIGDFPYDLTPYAIFLASLKYSFYPILTLCFILFLIYLKKDYGPMYKAEMRARKTGIVQSEGQSKDESSQLEDLNPVKNAPHRWYNAVIPVSLVILMTIIGLLHTGSATTAAELIEANGYDGRGSLFAIWSPMDSLFAVSDPGFFAKIGKIIGNADSYAALLWASFSGVIAAIILSVSQRIMKVFDTMHYFVVGVKTMMPAIIILALAWALALTTEELHTADYLSALMTGRVSPYLLPPITFVLAAGIAFSTGSSWSTMAILYPIAIPTTWAVCLAFGLPPDISLEILLNVIATVIAASVMGDHCSPISDTTILSSLASDCHHIDHVRTQLPYALTVGVVSIIIGTISTLLGGGWLLSLLLILIGLGVLYGVIRLLGKPVPQ